MIKVRRFTTFEGVGRRSWSEVLNLSKENYIFQTYDYLNNWWKYFGKGQKNKELLILAIEEGGLLKAIAPLMIVQIPFFRNKLIQFIGTDICDYMDFIIEPANFENFFLKYIEYLSKMDFLGIDLKFISESSETINSFGRLNKIGKISGTVSERGICPYIGINGDFFTVYSNINNKLKAEISRSEKKLKEKGTLEFKTYTNQDSLDNILNAYFDLHIKKWQCYNRKYSQFQYRHWRNFVYDLCVSLLEKENVDLSYLTFNGKIMACHFGFIYNNRLYYYMPTFDPVFSAYSPSKILIMKMLERSCEKGLEEFDFLRGREPYKMAWTKSFRTVYNLFYYDTKNPLQYLGFMYMVIRNSYANQIKPTLKKVRPLMTAWYALKRRQAS